MLKQLHMRTKIFIGVIALLVVAACKKMDDNYKQYIIPGGIVYPGKPIQAKFHPGKYRAMVSWKRGTDPKITKARIYWNNFTDSVEVQIAPKQDSVSHIFTNLQENIYSYTIRTMDENGNKSVPVELTGSVFGDRYQASLLNRAIASAIIGEDDKLTIIWGAADTTNGARTTEVRYTTVDGQTATASFSAKKDTSYITGVQGSNGFEYRTVFTPDTLAVDTFYTAYQQMPGSFMQIAPTTWTATADTYELTGQQPNGAPSKVLDGDIGTYWHTNHSKSPVTGYPHWLAFNMNRRVKVDRVVLASRSDYVREDFTDFIVQGSDDGTTWQNYGNFTLAEIAGPQTFTLTGAPVMRYLRIWQVRNATGSPHSHLAEFAVYGSFVL